jgi:competence protein ComEC
LYYGCFSFLAGAVPSIIRSAVMFSFILLADNLQRKTSIYNTLAASALVMLLVNPFFLWDVGFQLSYAAVISIVTFMKPISNWFYFENKIIRKVWQLNAVTLSAQILTLPIMLYHFHQFPNLFLLTNFVAVPLSGIILYLELILLLFVPFKAIAVWLGNIIAALIHFMNEYVERFNNLTISVTDNIQINFLQVCFLTLFLLSISFYFFSKHKILLFSSLASLFILLLIRSIDVIQKNKQQKIIVYNVPQHKAIDVITGNQYSFIGDDVLLEDDFLQNFHLKPSRILNRIHLNQQLNSSSSSFNFNNKKIVIIKNSILNLPTNKIDADLIIIQDNPSLSFTQLNKVFNCNNYVADASNSLWKIKKWKKDCENLHLRLHSVQEQGTYIMEF